MNFLKNSLYLYVFFSFVLIFMSFLEHSKKSRNFKKAQENPRKLKNLPNLLEIFV